jgi:hypothetical protein
VSGWETTSTFVTDDGNKTVTLTCPTPSKKVLGGGFAISASNASYLSKLAAVENYPSADNQWKATAVEVSVVNSSWTLTVYIICGSA